MSVENKPSFEILKIGPTYEKCENCGKESTYTKADYYIKKK